MQPGNFRGESQETIPQLSRCVLSGCGLHCGSAPGRKVSQSSWSPGRPWFCMSGFQRFSGPGAETQRRPGCYAEGGKGRGLSCLASDVPGEERLPWGRRSSFSQFCPLRGIWGSPRPSRPSVRALRPCCAHVCLTACPALDWAPLWALVSPFETPHLLSHLLGPLS